MNIYIYNYIHMYLYTLTLVAVAHSRTGFLWHDSGAFWTDSGAAFCTLYGFQEFCTYPKIQHLLIMLSLKITISDLIDEIGVFFQHPQFLNRSMALQFAVAETRFTLTCAVPRMVPSAAVEVSLCRGRSWHWKPSCIEVTGWKAQRLVIGHDLGP